MLGNTLRFGLLLFVAACTSSSPGSIDGTIKGNTYPVAQAISATIPGDGGGFGMILLSSSADACAPANAQVAHPGEKSLIVMVTATDANSKGQVPTATGTYAILDPTAEAPNAMVAFVFSSNLNATCENDGDDQATATAGTVTIDSIDNGVYAGSFDLTLDSGDHITGTFDPSSCSTLPDILDDSMTPTCKP